MSPSHLSSRSSSQFPPEHTSISIIALPDPDRDSDLASDPDLEQDPGDTWSGPSFQDSDEIELIDLAELTRPPPTPSTRARYASSSIRTLPAISPPPPLLPPLLPIQPFRPQRARAPQRPALASLSPARIVALVAGALLLIAITAIASQHLFLYLFQLFRLR
jgi:hypothetical protein